MKKQLFSVVLCAVLLAGKTTLAANDIRIMVELPAPMKAHMLENMRGHLVVVDQLIMLLSEVL